MSVERDPAERLRPRPVSRLRYLGGLVALGALQVGGGLLLHGLALRHERARRVLPLYRAQAWRVILGALRRERIRVEPRWRG